MMVATDAPILADKLYIPKHTLRGLRLESVQKDFTYFVKQDEELVTKKSYGVSRRYHTFHRGNLAKLDLYFDGSKPWRDRRCSLPMAHKLTFTGALYPEQLQCVNKWLGAKHGILEAPTGWGKTVAVLAILANLRQRALVLVSKIGHAETWLEEIYKHTNAKALDKLTGSPVCGIFETKTRTIHPCITIATYQSFIHGKSAEWYKENRHKWGLVWVDEADEAGADVYSTVVGSSRAKIRGGCTATPVRNDGLEDMVYDIIGPVTSRGIIPTMLASVTMVDTNIHIPPITGSRNAQWTKALQHIVSSDKYYDIVKRMIIHDVDAGRHLLVASDRNQILYDLFTDLDALDFLQGRVATLTGAVKGSDRKALIARARSGDLKVTLAQAKICNRNLNVPLWDCLHRVTPCSGWTRGEGKKRVPGTQLTQPLGRVVRHMMDKHGNRIQKPTPIVRHYCFSGNPVLVGVSNSCSGAYSYLKHTVVKRSYGEILAYGDETVDLQNAWDT